MGFKVVTSYKKFIGHSTDAKPTFVSGIGAELLELDTGQKYIWDGVGWVEDMSLYYAVALALGVETT